MEQIKNADHSFCSFYYLSVNLCPGTGHFVISSDPVVDSLGRLIPINLQRKVLSLCLVKDVKVDSARISEYLSAFQFIYAHWKFSCLRIVHEIQHSASYSQSANAVSGLFRFHSSILFKSERFCFFGFFSRYRDNCTEIVVLKCPEVRRVLGCNWCTTKGKYSRIRSNL